jgi:DeoR family transcriptional regulator, glycerol-3-phosphate regulon repressor
MSDLLSDRQRAILDLVEESGFVATEQLVDHFGVTPQTIRRDINTLCEANRLQRFHGGAGRSTSVENEPYFDRRRSLSPAKKQIAADVAAHIRDGSSLFLNIGTTTESVARALLNHRNLYVVTNNLHVASILAVNDSFEIMIAGGRLRQRDGGIIGPVTIDFVRQFRLDYGVIGVSGIDEDGALLDFDYEETKTAAAIIENSRETILVTDHTKFGRRAMTRFAHMSQIDRVYIDEFPAEPYAAMLQQSNVIVKIADLSPKSGSA